MRKYPILVILFATSMIFAADGEQRSNCLMDPLLHVMQTPQKGFVWLGNQEFHKRLQKFLTQRCETID
jgi:hypothetical protein